MASTDIAQCLAVCKDAPQSSSLLSFTPSHLLWVRCSKENPLWDCGKTSFQIWVFAAFTELSTKKILSLLQVMYCGLIAPIYEGVPWDRSLWCKRSYEGLSETASFSMMICELELIMTAWLNMKNYAPTFSLSRFYFKRLLRENQRVPSCKLFSWDRGKKVF